MGKEVSGKELTPAKLRVTTAGTNTVITPSAGKKLRLKYYKMAASPDNSATVNVTLQFIGSPVKIIDLQDLSQYGGVIASNLDEDFMTGAVNQGIEIITDVNGTVDTTVRYEEVD